MNKKYDFTFLYSTGLVVEVKSVEGVVPQDSRRIYEPVTGERILQFRFPIEEPFFLICEDGNRLIFVDGLISISVKEKGRGA